MAGRIIEERPQDRNLSGFKAILWGVYPMPFRGQYTIVGFEKMQRAAMMRGKAAEASAREGARKNRCGLSNGLHE
jgi:hypothetical protein